MVGRPPLPVGTWGSIATRQESNGRYSARCRFRDFDGETRKVTAFGKSGAEAERRLRASLQDRAQPAGENVTADTRLEAVVALWLREVDESDRAENTRRRYREVAELHVVPGLGRLRLREVNVAAVDRFLRANRDRTGMATAKLCRTVLSASLGLAARHGAVSTNPVRDAVTFRQREVAEVRALTVDEVARLRRAIRQDDAAGRVGLPDLIDVLLGTGLRIGEAVALRWQDVQLDADPPTLDVTGTVIVSKDSGLIRQTHTKSSRSRRRLTLPAFTVGVLSRLAESADTELVFPSRTGTLRDPSNVRAQWRRARRRTAMQGFEWVNPHTFRKSVATLISAEDLQRAADQLGHGQASMTERFYVMRTHEAPDVRDVLDAFGIDGGEDPDESDAV